MTDKELEQARERFKQSEKAERKGSYYRTTKDGQVPKCNSK